MLPNFLVIGAPRAGTSWIAKNLSAHPEVFIPRRQALHYFDRYYDGSLPRYARRFKGWRGEKAVGEATPAYLGSVPVPGRIRAHLPHIRLIASLRNPVERLHSRCLSMGAAHRDEARLGCEERLRQKPLLLEEGFYDEQLTRYLELFPRENLLVLLYDDLKREPAQFLERIYRFIGVNPSFRSPFLNETVCATADRRLRSGRNVLRNLARRLGGASGRPRKLPGPGSPLSAVTRAWLAEELYRSHNRRLEALIGRDLSEWDRP